jgi:acyl-CoA reductase-like NAD-dependent aldehyde dehydrogenase
MDILFPIIGAVVSIGSILIAVGVFKGKVNQAAEDNKAQDERIKSLASKDDLAAVIQSTKEDLKVVMQSSKDELTAAIKASDKMFDIITKRAEEDRAKGQGQWKEFYEILARHEGRIGILENQQTILMKTLDEIKSDIKSGFGGIQQELKELRNLH